MFNYMYITVYGNNAMSLRRNVWSHDLLKERLANYTSSYQEPKGGMKAKYEIIHSCRDDQIFFRMDTGQLSSLRWLALFLVLSSTRNKNQAGVGSEA